MPISLTGFGLQGVVVKEVCIENPFPNPIVKVPEFGFEVLTLVAVP